VEHSKSAARKTFKSFRRGQEEGKRARSKVVEEEIAVTGGTGVVRAAIGRQDVF